MVDGLYLIDERINGTGLCRLSSTPFIDPSVLYFVTEFTELSFSRFLRYQGTDFLFEQAVIIDRAIGEQHHRFLIEYLDGNVTYCGEYHFDAVHLTYSYSGRGIQFENNEMIYCGEWSKGMKQGSGRVYENGLKTEKGKYKEDEAGTVYRFTEGLRKYSCVQTEQDLDNFSVEEGCLLIDTNGLEQSKTLNWNRENLLGITDLRFLTRSLPSLETCVLESFSYLRCIEIEDECLSSCVSFVIRSE